MKRLGDVVHGPEPGRLHRRLDRSVLRQDHHRDLRVAGTDALQKLQPSQLRHLQIGNQNVDSRLLQQFQRLFGGRGGVDLESAFNGDVGAQVARGHFVINHQDRESGMRSSGSGAASLHFHVGGLPPVFKTEHGLCQISRFLKYSVAISCDPEEGRDTLRI